MVKCEGPPQKADICRKWPRGEKLCYLFLLLASFLDCKFEGQFLLHPTDRCKYIRCVHAFPPAKFLAIDRYCPYGTAVPREFYPLGNDLIQSQIDVERLCSEHIPRQKYDPYICKGRCSHHSARFYLFNWFLNFIIFKKITVDICRPCLHLLIAKKVRRMLYSLKKDSAANMDDAKGLKTD